MIPKVRLFRVARAKRELGQLVEAHSHNYYEFVYYLAADGYLYMNGEERRFKSGRFNVVPPRTQHSEKHLKEGSVFFCVFECDIPLDDRMYDDDHAGTVRGICERISSEFLSPKKYSEELLELLMRELILHVLRWDGADSAYRHDISYAAEYIERGFRENIDLHALSEEIGYGYDYFHHLFKKKYGFSPKQYQQHCRIECAKQLLLSGRYTCTEVAYLSGFSDSAQFSLIFKRECGVSPHSYVS